MWRGEKWVFKTLTLYSSHKTQKVARFHRGSYDGLQKNKENLFI